MTDNQKKPSQTAKSNFNNHSILLKINNRPQNLTDLELKLPSCQQHQVRFQDQEFPPNKQSLLGNPLPADYQGEWDKFLWRRAVEIFNGRPHYLFHGVSPDDIGQGSLGDCYFLSALSSLAENPDLIYRLFLQNFTEDMGVYSVMLNLNGMWKEIIIDDYFPVYYNQNRELSFAFSTTKQNELWVQLLEKAYAKCFGNFYIINGGFPVYALRDLTGAPYERLREFSDLEAIWEKVLTYERKGFIITCCTKQSEVIEEKNNNGLVSGHAYSILDAQEVIDSTGKRDRIVQIRNPWANFEWTGDWSDNSPKWTNNLKQSLAVAQRDDGLFWMSIRDVTLNFDEIGICKLFQNYFHTAVRIPRKPQNQHCIYVKVKKEQHLFLSIDQIDSRFFDSDLDSSYYYSYFRVTIGKLHNEYFKFVDCIMSADRNIFLERVWTEGDYVVLVEPYYFSKHATYFTCGIYSESNQISMVEVTESGIDLFCKTEQEIWKNFCLVHMSQWAPINMTNLDNKAVELSSYEHMSKDMGVKVYCWFNKSYKNKVDAQRQEFVNKGFSFSPQPVNRVIDLEIMPNNCDIILAKMDPRATEFSLKLQNVKDQVQKIEKMAPNATMQHWNRLKTDQSYQDAVVLQNQKNRQNHGIDKGNVKSYEDWIPDTKAGKFIKNEIDKDLPANQKDALKEDEGCTLI